MITGRVLSFPTYSSKKEIIALCLDISDAGFLDK